jgi:DNA-binding NarL/FixJ family response regulator
VTLRKRGLSDREIEVLSLVAAGFSNGQIGKRLFISPKTASVHVTHILTKLDASTRTEAATIGVRLGLPELDLDG